MLNQEASIQKTDVTKSNSRTFRRLKSLLLNQQ